MEFDDRALQSATRDHLRELQDERLRALLSEMASNQFYQEKFRLAGMEMTKVQGAASGGVGFIE